MDDSLHAYWFEYFRNCVTFGIFTRNTEWCRKEKKHPVSSRLVSGNALLMREIRGDGQTGFSREEYGNSNNHSLQKSISEYTSQKTTSGSTLIRQEQEPGATLGTDIVKLKR